MTERHGRVLAELTELGMGLARGLHARAEAAETLEEAEGLALAFHRISRAVRMTLALEARLAREARLDWREDFTRKDRLVEARKAQVRTALVRAVRAEAEGAEAERLLKTLRERLEEDGLYEEAFLSGPVEAQIARIRTDLGLPPEDPANDAGPPGGRPAFEAPRLEPPQSRSQSSGRPAAVPGGGEVAGLQPPQALRASSP